MEPESARRRTGPTDKHSTVRRSVPPFYEIRGGGRGSSRSSPERVALRRERPEHNNAELVVEGRPPPESSVNTHRTTSDSRRNP